MYQQEFSLLYLPRYTLVSKKFPSPSAHEQNRQSQNHSKVADNFCAIARIIIYSRIIYCHFTRDKTKLKAHKKAGIKRRLQAPSQRRH